MQAAYTAPLNPLFDSVSAKPLYSLAAGFTYIFSPELVNYFTPAFSWYESLFGPADWQKTLAAFPIVLQGSGANAPLTNIGGLDNTLVQGRRAARFFINDNLAWTIGPYALRYGTNTRIFRLNDYDFGEGVVHLVTYTTLPQLIHGVSSTASRTFPAANSQPYRFLNLDLYAQDTWKNDVPAHVDVRRPVPVQRSHVCARLAATTAQISAFASSAARHPTRPPAPRLRNRRGAGWRTANLASGGNPRAASAPGGKERSGAS